MIDSDDEGSGFNPGLIATRLEILPGSVGRDLTSRNPLVSWSHLTSRDCC